MLFLASKSEARRQLLLAAGVPFETLSVPFDEDAAKAQLHGLSAKDLAQTLAVAKLQSAVAPKAHDLILSADQTLALDGEILHKAANIEEARQTLKRLRAKNHALYSAIAIKKDDEVIFKHVATARLQVRAFSEHYLEDYLAKAGSALTDAVGCYHYEGLGLQLFNHVKGDHSTVLGLPLLPLLAFLRQIGHLKT
jgi:septum formation protein